MASSARALASGVLVCGLLAGSVDANADGGGSWIDRAPLETPRQEVGAARIGDRVYVVGGLLAGFPLSATPSVEVYDIAQDRWSSAAPLPVGLDHMGVAALDGRLYAIGGFSGDFVARSEVYVYDPADDEWSPGPPLPEPRGAPWAVAHGDRIFVFGGVDASDTPQATTYVLDPDAGGGAGAWETGADMPTAREHLTAVSLGDFVYVIGGRFGFPFGSVPANERYDPVADDWQVLKPMPTARSATATAACDGRIVVAGGEVPQLFDVTEVYDPETGDWDCLEPMAIPRHGVAAVSLGDRMLVPAGGVVQGLAPTAANDVFVCPEPGVTWRGAGLAGALAVVARLRRGVAAHRSRPRPASSTSRAAR